MLGHAVSIRSPEPYQDTSDPRFMRPVRIRDSSIDLDVMIYRDTVSERTPLVIINSIELPMPPSAEFCDLMWEAGYQVVFIRRPGFGGAPGLPDALLTENEVRNGAAVITEAALIQRLISTLELKPFVLLGLGTANSVCVRLSKLCPSVKYAIFSNPLFHQDVWDLVRPRWMQSMVRQTLVSKGGLRFTVKALKATLKRNPNWFYRQFSQKSPGDMEYVAENAPDFEAAANLLQNMSQETVYYDLQMALVHDTNVDADFFRDINGVILCGTETTEHWRQRMQEQSERTAFPLTFAPSGDLFVPYKSPQVLLDLMDAQVRKAKRA